MKKIIIIAGIMIAGTILALTFFVKKNSGSNSSGTDSSAGAVSLSADSSVGSSQETSVASSTSSGLTIPEGANSVSSRDVSQFNSGELHIMNEKTFSDVSVDPENFKTQLYQFVDEKYPGHASIKFELVIPRDGGNVVEVGLKDDTTYHFVYTSDGSGNYSFSEVEISDEELMQLKEACVGNGDAGPINREVTSG